jgi:RNA polymerase sigma-70 factor (ECF subfamily)
MALTPTTRASLLLRLRDPRDHEAWLEFVSLYEPVVYRLLRHHGLQDADAREVMQNFFMAVSRSIDQFDTAPDRGSFRGWLRRVTRNLLTDWLRQGQRRALMFGGSHLLAMLENLPDASGPESQEFDQELRRQVFQRAAELVQDEFQPQTWQAFWQTSVDGISTAQVAANLGISAGAVRVARSRVLARLRSAVRNLEEVT